MEKKGQGALEYLLLIGGAVLVAVIVITLLLQITSTGQTDTQNTADISSCINRQVLACPNSAIDAIRTACTTTPTTTTCPPP